MIIQFLDKWIEAVLLSERQDPQQYEHQDGEGQGPYKDAGKQVQRLTCKSQRDQNSQFQYTLTTCQQTQLDANLLGKAESSPELPFPLVSLQDIVASAQGQSWSKNIASVRWYCSMWIIISDLKRRWAGRIFILIMNQNKFKRKKKREGNYWGDWGCEYWLLKSWC